MKSLANPGLAVTRPRGPRWLRNWLERHQHPFSFWVHLVGIPLTVAALPFLFTGYWVWFLVLFIGGYALQFLGHAIEGNDAGELILIKKWLGKPYVAVAPRPAAQSPETTSMNIKA